MPLNRHTSKKSNVGTIFSNFKKREQLFINSIDYRRNNKKRTQLTNKTLLMFNKIPDVEKKEFKQIKLTPKLSGLQELFKELRKRYPKEDVDLALEKISYIDRVKFEKHDKHPQSVINLLNSKSELNKELADVIPAVRKTDKKFYY